MLPICLTKFAAYEWINKHPRFSSYMTSIFKTLAWTLSALFSGSCFVVNLPVCLSTIFAGTYRMNLKSLKFVSMDLHLHTKSLKLQYKSIVKKLSHGNFPTATPTWSIPGQIDWTPLLSSADLLLFLCSGHLHNILAFSLSYAFWSTDIAGKGLGLLLQIW